MGKNCALGLEYGPRPSALGRTQDNLFIFFCFFTFFPLGRV